MVKAVLRPRSPERSVQLDESTVPEEAQDNTAAGAAERAAEAPEEDNLHRAAATGEFGVDTSPETRFHRIQSSIRNLQYIGFDGAEGLIEAACQIVSAGNWEGTYVDGRRPLLCGQPPLDVAESLLLDNYVAEYLRVQYRIQAEANFRATAEHWERGTRGRQDRPSLRNLRGSARAPFRLSKSDPGPHRWTHGSPHQGSRSSHDPLSFAQVRQAIPP